MARNTTDWIVYGVFALFMVSGMLATVAGFLAEHIAIFFFDHAPVFLGFTVSVCTMIGSMVLGCWCMRWFLES
jgi:hypothetical protein